MLARDREMQGEDTRGRPCLLLAGACTAEAEWEKAASWDVGARHKGKWPWGDDWDAQKCNSRESGRADTTPVGHFSRAGDSPCGAADMAGNVWEWCQSSYKPYPYRAEDGREDLKVAGSRVLRGGAFCDSQWYVRCAFRDLRYPLPRHFVIWVSGSGGPRPLWPLTLWTLDL